MDDIKQLRTQIDSLDEKLLEVLAERFSVVESIKESKIAHGIQTEDLDREQEVITERKRIARELGLREELVEALFEVIIKYSKKAQQ